MGQKSDIQWTDATWTPIRAQVKRDAAEIADAKGYRSLVQIAAKMAGRIGPHCEHESPGCENCYSETNNGRCLPANGTGLPFDRRSRDLVDVFLDSHILGQPLHWKTPKRIFVCSQTDLFGDWVPDDMILAVFQSMAKCPAHIFQVLTKHPGRALQFLASRRWRNLGNSKGMSGDLHAAIIPGEHREDDAEFLANVWIGVSAENQEMANKRVPLLLQIPAAVRFVSYEPALGPVDLTHIPVEGEMMRNALTGDFYNVPFTTIDEKQYGLMTVSTKPKIAWLIVGGESGRGARPFNIAWAAHIVRQCREARVACFVKQMGSVPIVAAARQNHYEWGEGNFKYWQDEHSGMWRITLKDRSGSDMSKWADYLRVRQFPYHKREVAA